MKLWKKEKDDWWEARDAYQAEDGIRWDRKWTAAFIIGAICIYIMRYIEIWRYGRVIETNWEMWMAGIIGGSIGTLIGNALRKNLGGKQEISKRRKLAGCFIVLLLAAWMILLVYPTKERWIFGGQMLILVPLSFLFYWMETRDEKKQSLQAWSYSLMFVSITAVTFVLPQAIGFITTKEAEAIVTEEGYTEAEYLGWLYARWIYKDAQTKPFPEPQEKEKQYYMVFGRKDSEPYRFLIDPDGGDIILAATEEDEPLLGNWYRSKE